MLYYSLIYYICGLIAWIYIFYYIKSDALKKGEQGLTNGNILFMSFFPALIWPIVLLFYASSVIFSGISFLIRRITPHNLKEWLDKKISDGKED